MSQGFTSTLWTAQVDGAALTNTTTATSLLHAGAKYPMFPGALQSIGQELKIQAAGRISTVVTSPGTFTFDLKFGSTIVATSGALSLNVVAKTNVTWKLDWDLTVRAVGGGTACTLMHTGTFTSEAVIGSPLPTAGGSGVLLIPASAPAVGSGFDNTASQIVDLFGTWQTANAANSILVHQFRVISPN
jgi:hypothetical protein